MVVRAPVVVGPDGELQELQSGDKLPNTSVNEAILPLFYGGIVLERQEEPFYTPTAGYMTIVVRNSDGRVIQVASDGSQRDLTGPKITVSATAPASPQPGDIWIDSSGN